MNKCTYDVHTGDWTMTTIAEGYYGYRVYMQQDDDHNTNIEVI